MDIHSSYLVPLAIIVVVFGIYSVSRAIYESRRHKRRLEEVQKKLVEREKED